MTFQTAKATFSPVRATLLTATALVSAPALAQTSDSAEMRADTDIVVTAQKRAEPLQKVPLSVQALSTETLSEHNVNSFEDYARLLPSLSFQTFGPGQAQVYFRGISNGTDLATGSLPTVGVYLDEQPVTTIGQALDVHIYDIERVEALAGPQGTLYGASSEAGTLRIITNKPDPDKFEAGFDGTLQSVAHGKSGGIAEGFANIPVAEDVAVRLVGFYEKDPGYIDNVLSNDEVYPTSGIVRDNSALVRKDINATETYGGRAMLRAEFGDWSVTPTLMYQHLEAKGSPAYRLTTGYLKNTRFLPESYRDHWVQAALTIEGKLGPLDLTYAGAWLDRKTQYVTDYSDYSYFYDQYYVSYPDYFGNLFVNNAGNLIDPAQLLTGDQHYRKMSHELRVSLPKQNGFQFVAGLFHQRQTNDWTNLYIVDGLADDQSITGRPGVNYANIQDRTDRDYAAFGQASYDITPQLTFTAGLRVYRYNNDVLGFFGYNADKSDVGEAICFPESVGNAKRGRPCDNIDASAKGNGLRHKLSLSWQIDPQRMVYASWSTGFRPGGINRRATAAPYSAEKLTNYELGWKTRWLNGRLRFNGDVFLEKLSDAQFSVTSDENGITDIVNAGRARSWGIEAQLDLVPASGLTLSASGTYVKATLRTDLCNYANPQFDCTLPSPSGNENSLIAPAGTRFPATPRFKATATARYEFDVGGGVAHLQGTLFHQSKVYPTLAVEERALLGTEPDYVTVDLAAGFDREPWSIELVASNLFDRHAEVSRYASCVVSVCGEDAIQVIPLQPRLISLRLGYRF